MDLGRLLYNGNGVNVMLNVHTTWIEFSKICSFLLTDKKQKREKRKGGKQGGHPRSDERQQFSPETALSDEHMEVKTVPAPANS